MSILRFAQFLDEDRRGDDDGWTNQYTKNDLKRIDRAQTYLFHRGFRKGAKTKEYGVNHGVEELGHGQARRTMSVAMKRGKKEYEIRAKPEAERSNAYRKALAKRVRGYNRHA